MCVCVCVCARVCVLTSVLGVVCVCNLAMSCCFSSGGWSFLVSLGNVLSLSLSLSLFPSKAGQEFSPSRYPKQGQRVSNSFCF